MAIHSRQFNKLTETTSAPVYGAGAVAEEGKGRVGVMLLLLLQVYLHMQRDLSLKNGRKNKVEMLTAHLKEMKP
jgi:hypothetical protein